MNYIIRAVGIFLFVLKVWCCYLSRELNVHQFFASLCACSCLIDRILIYGCRKKCSSTDYVKFPIHSFLIRLEVTYCF